jgi:uncharacterized iron-regulated membrane protein
MTFRGVLMWIHLVLGLTGAVIIGIVALTGAYITFQRPLHQWLTPIPELSAPRGPANALAIVATVEMQFAPRRVASIAVSEGQVATWVRLNDRSTVFVDPATGTIVGSRLARFASLENLTLVMRGLHMNLVLGPRGQLIVTAATLEALLLALTGLWLWWRKKHWQFRAWRGSVFRVSWDLHNASAIWFLVPVLLMVGTGLLISMPGTVYRVVGVPPSQWLNPPHSAERVPESAEPVPLARVLSVADSAQPGEVLGVTIPGAPSGAFAVRKARETVFVDQFTGAVIEVRPHRVDTASDLAVARIEHLHTGELLGVPGQVVMTLGTLMLAVSTITGTLLGCKRLLILAGRRARTNGDD